MSETAAADGRALGGLVRLVVTRPEALSRAMLALEQLLAEVDLTYSRFRADSELSVVNSSPGREHEVSPLLAQAVDTALRAARFTGGLVDPTIGEAIRVAGYDRTFEDVDPTGPALRLTATRIPGWQAVAFDQRARTLRIPEGVELDLGATGKGLAADLGVAAALQAAGDGTGVLVSLGGDIAVAGPPPEGGWVVQASEDSAAPIATGEEAISIRSGGVATSSTTVRRWVRGSVEMHHILDPATGQPARTRWRTACVVAGTCADANAASTAAIVLGDKAEGWLAGHRLPARLVDQQGNVTRLAGWPVTL